MTKYRFDGQTLQQAVGCASAHRSERTAPNIGSRPTGRGRESHPPWGGRTRSGADAPAGHLTDVCPVIPAKAGASQGKRDKCSGISRPGLRAGTSTPPQEVPDQVRDGWSSARRVRPCPPQSKLPSTASSLAHTGWRAEFGAAMNSSTTRTRSVLATRPSVTTCSPASRWSSRSATSRKSASAG